LHKEKTVFKVTIIGAIVSTILFRGFILLIGKIISDLQIERLIFDIDFRFLIFSIIELIGILVFFYIINKQLLIPKSTNFVYYILAIVLAVIYVFSHKYLNWFYDFIFTTDYFHKMKPGFKVPIHTNLLIARVFLIPISEELFFRKFIQKGLQDYYNGYIAIIISCLLFTIVHLSDFHNMFLIFFGALISSILYYKSNSIIPSILFHISWNLFVLIL